jgi:hypothetical protein
MVAVGVAHGAAISEAGGSGSGVALDVANAIRDYLARAKGDARLALALSVADEFLSQVLSLRQHSPGRHHRQGVRHPAGRRRSNKLACITHHAHFGASPGGTKWVRTRPDQGADGSASYWSEQVARR